MRNSRKNKIKKIYLNNNFFKSEKSDVDCSFFENEFYLVKISLNTNKIFIAQKKDFINYEDSSKMIFSLKEDCLNLKYLLEHLNRKPRDISELKNGSICNDCAFDFNLSWPKGHCATFWNGPCSQCEKDKMSCCSTGDYNYRFKGGMKKVYGMRD